MAQPNDKPTQHPDKEHALEREGHGFSERYGGGVPGQGDGQLGNNDRAELRGDYGTPPPGQRDNRLQRGKVPQPKAAEEDNGARQDGVPPPVS